MHRGLDDIDLVILDRLQDDGRVTRSRLAGIVGRSVPAVSARMRKLEHEGVIIGIHAALSPERMDQSVLAFSWVTLRSKRDERTFAEYACALQEVLELHAITDAAIQVLKIRTRSMAGLQRILAAIHERPGVQRIATSVVITTHRATRRLPLPRGGDGALTDGVADAGTRPD